MRLPRAEDLPDFDITLTGVPTNANPLGVKGSGQAGAMASPQAIIAAMLDALAPLGVTHIDMPATPERVWRRYREGGAHDRPAALRSSVARRSHSPARAASHARKAARASCAWCRRPNRRCSIRISPA